MYQDNFTDYLNRNAGTRCIIGFWVFLIPDPERKAGGLVLTNPAFVCYVEKQKIIQEKISSRSPNGKKATGWSSNIIRMSIALPPSP